MKLEKNKLYRPADISDNGWILNWKRTKDYFFVLKQIKEGNLKSYPAGKKGYLVRGEDIIAYKVKFEGYTHEENSSK